MSKKIKVNTQKGSYTYSAGSGIFQDELQIIARRHETERFFVLIDENVEKYHGVTISGFLDRYTIGYAMLTVPEGEKSKSLKYWSEALDFLLNNGVKRTTPVLVIGGGVTGDVGGFAAASVLRGVPLYHIPTTLLAMVDSSIGGKTGINHAKGKNLIGAFYQPSGVISDMDFLKTLPQNEWINGLSEILKYGAIQDATIFEDAELFLEDDFSPDHADDQKILNLILKCAKVKIDIVEKDETEKGIRAYLNFGHTFAHALEKECGYDSISHGEAVFLGMLAAQKLSMLHGGNVEGNYLERFSHLYHYRVQKEALSLSSLFMHMQVDKKNTGSEIRFILLDSWQHPVLKSVNKESHLSTAWNEVFNRL